MIMSHCNNIKDIPEIQDYIDIVRENSKAPCKYPVCKEQILLMDYVEKCFNEENLYVDTELLANYLRLEVYFPFNLFEWEKFVFTLHNCTFRENGLLRWPDLFCMVGRGTGKNGYLSFETFALISPYNDIKKYHITICANSEGQATTSFFDVYDMLQDNEKKMKKWFEWNKTTIKCIKTGSELGFATSNPSTKDGGRQGMVAFDEIHQYENFKILNVFTSGLGKKKDPRRTFITTNGYVREGPLDKTLEKAKNILKGAINDNGMLPFICKLDDEKEFKDKKNWHKANPSLRYLPFLQQETEKEYHEYLENPIDNPDFMTKRMNVPKSQNEDREVTTWENILATNQKVPYKDLEGCTCRVGIDYAKTTDFVCAGLLFKYGEKYIWISHTWVCKKSKDLKRIKAPIEEWAKLGLLTMVDDVEIPPSLVAEWLSSMAQQYNLTILGMDNFRWTLLRKALNEVGFDTDKNGANNVKLTRPSDQMKVYPKINSLFNKHNIVYGDSPLMRWYTNNTCLHPEKYENYTFAKIEPKSRKTDGFMAFVAAMCTGTDDLEDSAESFDINDLLGMGVHTY